ncbi:hypothetical protein D3C73_1097860 [compost metagenome]
MLQLTQAQIVPALDRQRLKLRESRQQRRKITLRNPRNLTFLIAHLADEQLAERRKAGAVFHERFYNVLRAVLICLAPVSDNKTAQRCGFGTCA